MSMFVSVLYIKNSSLISSPDLRPARLKLGFKVIELAQELNESITKVSHPKQVTTMLTLERMEMSPRGGFE
jgi:hypothetical protein